MYLLIKRTNEEQNHFIETETNTVIRNMSETDKQELSDLFEKMNYFQFKKNDQYIYCFSIYNQDKARKILDKNIHFAIRSTKTIGLVIDFNVYIYDMNTAIEFYKYYETQKLGEEFIKARIERFDAVCKKIDAL